MAELSVEALQIHLQATLNSLELWKALEKHVADPHVKEALALLIDDGQEALVVLSAHLRRQGVAPGVRKLDYHGRAKIREALSTRVLRKQLLAVRRSLADMVEWYQTHMPTVQSDPAYDWLVSLSAQTHGMLQRWDQHIEEMKAV